MKNLIIGMVLSVGIVGNAFAGVKIFTQDGCGPCEQAKAYLQQKGVPYSECNIANPKCLNQYNRLGGNGTPLIMINGQRIDGFSEGEIDRALGR